MGIHLIHTYTHRVVCIYNRYIGYNKWLNRCPAAIYKYNICSIKKTRNIDELNNYKSINLLSALSYLLETLMYNKVVSFLGINTIIYQHQCGFRANHATIHPIMHLINQCPESNNTKSNVDLL